MHPETRSLYLDRESKSRASGSYTQTASRPLNNTQNATGGLENESPHTEARSAATDAVQRACSNVRPQIRRQGSLGARRTWTRRCRPATPLRRSSHSVRRGRGVRERGGSQRTGLGSPSYRRYPGAWGPGTFRPARPSLRRGCAGRRSGWVCRSAGVGCERGWSDLSRGMVW
ncbi:hypothetical protein PV05_05922 [Exophiala xenobiotica]|uniref:Uncharacterized protein n=1 Tax=Exophiala xenobiotica TaxID=348802 RepID=A0A0D2EPD9_9EURO|nr:uncharacterized protein PV05_05922 [Exophiala xenobiotica]KIW57368.1 hypothetical protein PV05_05922 [Exophiala xenobiotica]